MHPFTTDHEPRRVDVARIASAIALVVLQSCATVPTTAALPPPEPVKADEAAAWESALHVFTTLSLHDAHAQHFADGSKGLWLGHVVASSVAPVFPPGITRFDDYKRWSAMCRYPLVVTATFRDAVPFLINDRHMIATRARFTIDDVVAAPDDLAQGATIDLGIIGGELDDDGEHLRVVSEDVGGPFVAGQEYLLLGDRGPRMNVPWPMLDGGRFVGRAVARKVGDLLYVENVVDHWSLLRTISEYSTLRRQLTDLAARVPCRTP